MKHSTQKQHGVALVVSLILLLLLTVLAITASNSSSLQERMAFNSQESNVAFQTAESALADTVRQLDNDITPSSDRLFELTYENPDRTTRARVEIDSYEAFGNSIGIGISAPIITVYDISSRATLDPSATTAGAIDADNTSARHLQGYRDREVR